MAVFFNRRRSAGSINLLPAGYTQLEYIENSGTQYINTGYMPNNYTKLDIVVESDATMGGVAVCDAAWLSDGFGVWIHCACFGDSVKQDLAFMGAKTNLVLDKGILYQDGEEIWSASGTFQTTCALTLFALNRNGSMTEFISSAKIYSCKLYNNNELIRNFIPCKNPMQDVGMYDTVTAAFYGNEGSGAFIAGPEV